MKIFVIGAGFTGMQLARALVLERNDVVLIDNDPERVRDASDESGSLKPMCHFSLNITLAKPILDELTVCETLRLVGSEGVGKEASGEAKTGSSSGRVLTEYLGFLQGWN